MGAGSSSDGWSRRCGCSHSFIYACTQYCVSGARSDEHKHEHKHKHHHTQQQQPEEVARLPRPRQWIRVRTQPKYTVVN